MERLLDFVRTYPIQIAALGGLVLVVIFAWLIESSAWRTRHR